MHANRRNESKRPPNAGVRTVERDLSERSRRPLGGHVKSLLASWRLGLSFTAALVLGTFLVSLHGADHGDVPSSLGGTRFDANITDLYAFQSGPNLVLVVSTNPAIPSSASSYVFPADVTFEIHIDTNATVVMDSWGDGATILDPMDISEEITFRVRFRDDGSASLQRFTKRGMDTPPMVGFFAGLRDDPFIRAPRIGKNVGAIVIEVPMSSVLLDPDQTALLIWATAKVDEFDGSLQELAGRALRSMFPENILLNTMHPRLHMMRLGLRPDVMIYDTARPTAFPNGRALTDDVVDLVNDWRVVSTDAPFPTKNDVPFLTDFPYLAPPHAAP